MGLYWLRTTLPIGCRKLRHSAVNRSAALCRIEKPTNRKLGRVLGSRPSKDVVTIPRRCPADPEGNYQKLIANLMQYNGQPYTLAPASGHGQNTEGVLLDAGLSRKEVAACKAEGAIP